MINKRIHTKSFRNLHKSDQFFKQSFISPQARASDKSPGRDLTEEKKSVEKLEFWNFKKDHELLVRTSTAREILKKKLRSEDLVETFLHKRKLIGNQDQGLTNKEISKYYKNYEEECLNSYNDIKQKLDQKVENRDSTRKALIDLKSESDKEKKRLKEIEKIRLLAPHKLGSLKESENLTQTFSNLIKQRNMFIQKNDQLRNELIQNLDMLSVEIKNKNRDLVYQETEIRDLRSGLKLVKQDIIKHFLAILKEGTDTKGEGLYTTVKFLLGFKIELGVDNFPEILDESSVKCIIKLAEKHLELEDLYEKFLKSSGKSKSVFNSMTIQERLASLKKTIKIRKPNYRAKKKDWLTQEMLNCSEDPFANTGFSETVKLEEKINLLKQEIREIKETEIKRLTRECLKTGKSVQTLSSYIVGTDNLVKYKIVILKEFQTVEKVKEKTQTFSFTNYLVPKAKINLNKESAQS